MNTVHLRRLAKELRFTPGVHPTEVVAEALEDAASVIDRLQHDHKLVARTERGEVWYWQGDGHDYPESLGCPVVIDENDLRDLIRGAAMNTVSDCGIQDGMYIHPPHEA